MSEMTTLTHAEKRDSLRARIEAAERRNAERTLADQAREAAAAATEYTRAHPLTVFGGALALGLLVGLATRPGRRVATRAAGAVGSAASGAASSAAAGVKSAAARGGSQITALLGDAALAWGMKVLDDLIETARTGQDRVEDLADEAEATARKVKRDAAHAVGTASDTVRHTARKTRRKTSRAVRDTVSKVKG
ncbi:MAG: hypothetical protein V2I74_13195 [Erythrobacter sp.]|jgi:ElaB/YqjD/DUF883 family membrane-anchored ribosome-binding protein|nr:hypothetical protein [Erythrobacter sp.]